MFNNKASPVLAILFFVVLILFSGCLEQDEQVKKDTGETDALALDFTPGAPPDAVPEKDSFDVSLTIENKGEYDLRPGDVYILLAGVNPSSLSKSSAYFQKTNEDELMGTRIIDDTKIPGGLESIEWNGLSYIVDISSDQNIKFIAQACYDYQTTITADVCLSANPYAQTTGGESCVVQGEKGFSNTIAPVKATKIVENPAGKNKFTFTFTIENLGKGDVYDVLKDESECGNLQLRDLDKVRVAKFSIGSQEIESCKDKEIRLVDGEGKFFCTAKIDNIAGDYKDLLTVKLDYGYRSKASKTTTIKNMIGEETDDSVYEPEEEEDKCKDSDNGKTYDEQGQIEGLYIGYPDSEEEIGYNTDHCVNETILKEFYCVDADNYSSVEYECEHGCSEGACEPEPVVK